MVLKKLLCRLLIALTAWMPFEFAHAGMIGTESAAAASIHATPSANRAHVLALLERADVASKLQSLGIDPAQAKSRVNAMSDQEVASLAGQIEALPAAGMSNGWAIVLIILVVAGVWWYFSGRTMR